jgi:hypothetical protein
LNSDFAVPCVRSAINFIIFMIMDCTTKADQFEVLILHELVNRPKSWGAKFLCAAAAHIALCNQRSNLLLSTTTLQNHYCYIIKMVNFVILKNAVFHSVKQRIAVTRLCWTVLPEKFTAPIHLVQNSEVKPARYMRCRSWLLRTQLSKVRLPSSHLNLLSPGLVRFIYD